jgi:protein gp37
MNKTKIDWANYSWSPVIGCSGQDCSGAFTWCYARKMAHRFHRDFTPHWVEKNFARAMPKKPARIFVNSMSDLADWEDDWLDNVTTRIATHPEHLFLFLSKRPWAASWTSLPNAMLGYSVTRQADLDLLAKHGHGNVSFLSIEPLLGPVSLSLAWQPQWLICGAETGNRKGRVVPEPAWIEDIYEYATGNDIPLFFKESLKAHWPFDGYDYFPQEYPKLRKEENGNS